MNLSNFIAKRYFFSRKKTNAINIISGLSMGVFLTGTAVMIIILSLLNGLEDLVKESNNAFDPDFKIEVKKGKVFNPDIILSKLEELPISQISKVLEENVVVRYADAQEIARIKGVDQNFNGVTNLDTLLAAGTTELSAGNFVSGIFGLDLASRLNINVNNEITSAEIIVPKRGAKYRSIDPSQSLNVKYVMPSGILTINKDDERDFLIVPISVTRELLEYENEVSALEIRIPSKENSKKLKALIEEQVGDDFVVRDRYEQNETAYNVFKSEKWLTFALLSLILLVAAFNAVGALTMLVLEKSKDLKILDSLGMQTNQIRNIYLKEGFMLSVSGAVIGMLLGLLFCYLQATYGLISLDGSLIDFFPVHVKIADVMAVIAVIIIMGFLSALYPAKLAVKLSGGSSK